MIQIGNVYKYTEEQIEYVRSIAEGRYNQEIADLFNKQFGLNVTPSKINSLKCNHKIRSNVSRGKPYRPESRLLSPEQEKFVRANVKGRSNQELTDLVNEKFKLNLTRQQINTWKSNRGLSSGLTGQFEKGQEPWNKGLKGINTGGEAGWFKKGQRPINYVEIGTVVVDGEGYTRVKISDEGTYQQRFKLMHHKIWEKANGPIPEDKILIFADGDRSNITLDNLLLVTRKQLVRLNQNDLISNDRELTETGLIIADIINKTGELKNS